MDIAPGIGQMNEINEGKKQSLFSQKRSQFNSRQGIGIAELIQIQLASGTRAKIHAIHTPSILDYRMLRVPDFQLENILIC